MKLFIPWAGQGRTDPGPGPRASEFRQRLYVGGWGLQAGIFSLVSFNIPVSGQTVISVYKMPFLQRKSLASVALGKSLPFSPCLFPHPYHSHLKPVSMSITSLSPPQPSSQLLAGKYISHLLCSPNKQTPQTTTKPPQNLDQDDILQYMTQTLHD